MGKINSFYETIDSIITSGVNANILHLSTDRKQITNNIISISGQSVINFGSCSYLGLEFDDRIKASAQNAISMYGTQFAESRAYVSISLYQELESQFEKIFGSPAVVFPTTTLGHIGCIPVLVGNKDAIILDHQVHNSVHTAVEIMKARGAYVELLRHNNMDMLEDRIKILRQKYKRIWYMADGIYSMFGDKSPVKKVNQLMEKYSELWYYVDDAHGMSIYGKNGNGYVLSEQPISPKMILVTSLAKAFASGGAVVVFPNKELARQIRTCASTLITSGPMQPGNLGAALASAEIHLSGEIYTLQDQLQDNIKYTNYLLKKYNLPLISTSDAAVFYIGVALPKIGYSMVKRMMNKGYYLNLGIFPAVPIKNTGIRFTITRMHSFAEIESMLSTLSLELEEALKENSYTLEHIYKDFRLPTPDEMILNKACSSLMNQSLSLQVKEYDSIHCVDKNAWNNLFSNKGTFDWDGLAMLQKSFSGNKEPENCWQFKYIIVKDNFGEVVLATFLTSCLVKDDMLSSSEISEEIEYRRKSQPDYLTSKTVVMGSLITEGEHLFLNKTHSLRDDAFLIFAEKLGQFQESVNATKIILRDFAEVDPEIDSLIINNGFFRVSMPNTNIVTNLNWENEEAFYNQLSFNSKKNFRKYVDRNRHHFNISWASEPSDEEIKEWYSLYMNVKNKSYQLNTYALPFKLFQSISRNPNWEVMLLNLNREADDADAGKLVGVVLCNKSGENYIPMIIGLNYEYNSIIFTYRQALFQVINRARELNKKQVYFGFSAEIEKKKLGAKQITTSAYLQVKDNYEIQAVAGSQSGSILKKTYKIS
jgi:7-keto-8-aminopelargonate synthetase-like enzyme/arginyl-tRNA--protein-N-Asp/Glu arginylyltransferase